MITTARLETLSVSWFATNMGLSGFAIAWMRAGDWLEAPEMIGAGLLLLSLISFTMISILYASKVVFHLDSVMKELSDPEAISFFPAFSIALLLLSIVVLHGRPDVSKVLCGIGIVLHLIFTLYVMSVWINRTDLRIQDMSPAWFIPVVGNILVPVASVPHYPVEVSWFFFSIGLLFWFVMLTIVLYRIIFHEPLPNRLVPTLVILIAPPAVGFISYIALVGHVDVFASILYNIALFFVLLLSTQLWRFARLRFYLSWWAYSFPMAAVTIATLRMAQQTSTSFFVSLSWGLLSLLTLIMALLVAKTALALIRKQI